jgi:hypothetical protein
MPKKTAAVRDPWVYLDASQRVLADTTAGRR